VSILVACTSKATSSNFTTYQKMATKRDKKKILCSYYKKPNHWVWNYKKKVVDLKKHAHTQKIATIDEQTFFARTCFRQRILVHWLWKLFNIWYFKEIFFLTTNVRASPNVHLHGHSGCNHITWATTNVTNA